MPIAKQFRHFYRGLHWRETRERILRRAGNKCEFCQKAAGETYFNQKTNRLVIVQLGVAHLDHYNIALFYDPANLRALCRACHLRQDMLLHLTHARSSRCHRKDNSRPLFESVNETTNYQHHSM